MSNPSQQVTDLVHKIKIEKQKLETCEHDLNQYIYALGNLVPKSKETIRLIVDNYTLAVLDFNDGFSVHFEKTVPISECLNVEDQRHGRHPFNL